MDDLLDSILSTQKSSRKKTVHSIVLPTSEAVAFRFEMWELYRKYYTTERRAFFDRFQQTDCYAIYWYGKTMIGFTAIRMRPMQIGTQQILTFYLGQSVIQKAFRGKSLIAQTCAKLFLKHYLRRPLVPIYVWCDALTYKPYLLFANAFQTYYPTPKIETPRDVQQIIQQVGQTYYADSFDEATGTVHKAANIIEDHSITVQQKDLEHPAIRFFVNQNPKHLAGHGLLTIAPVHFRNLVSLIKHLWWKRLRKAF